MKQHKHHDAIVAWAKGSKIEYFSEVHNVWRAIGNPDWSTDSVYRVKKEPVIKYHGITRGPSPYEKMNGTTGYHAEPGLVRGNDPSWKVIAIVKTTFEGLTPVKSEIIENLYV